MWSKSMSGAKICTIVDNFVDNYTDVICGSVREHRVNDSVNYINVSSKFSTDGCAHSL